MIPDIIKKNPIPSAIVFIILAIFAYQTFFNQATIATQTFIPDKLDSGIEFSEGNVYISGGSLFFYGDSIAVEGVITNNNDFVYNALIEMQVNVPGTVYSFVQSERTCNPLTPENVHGLISVPARSSQRFKLQSPSMPAGNYEVVLLSVDRCCYDAQRNPQSCEDKPPFGWRYIVTDDPLSIGGQSGDPKCSSDQDCIDLINAPNYECKEPGLGTSYCVKKVEPDDDDGDWDPIIIGTCPPGQSWDTTLNKCIVEEEEKEEDGILGFTFEEITYAIIFLMLLLTGLILYRRFK